jgi:hypothetical protein
MIVARSTALMANGNDILRDPFTKTLIKYKVFADKPVVQSVFFDLPGIFYDTAVELKHITESMVFHPGTGFFASYSSRAIHQKILILLVFHKIFYDLKFFPEGIDIGANGMLEMTYLTFIMISHIHNNGIRVFGQLIKFLGIHMDA